MTTPDTATPKNSRPDTSTSRASRRLLLMIALLAPAMFIYVFIVPSVHNLITQARLTDPVETTGTLVGPAWPRSESGRTYQIFYAYDAVMPDGATRTLEGMSYIFVSDDLPLPTEGGQIAIIYSRHDPHIVMVRDHSTVSDWTALLCMVCIFTLGGILLAGLLLSRTPARQRLNPSSDTSGDVIA